MKAVWIVGQSANQRSIFQSKNNISYSESDTPPPVYQYLHRMCLFCFLNIYFTFTFLFPFIFLLLFHVFFH
jgi:hypothetical protein